MLRISPNYPKMLILKYYHTTLIYKFYRDKNHNCTGASEVRQYISSTCIRTQSIEKGHASFEHLNNAL